MSRTKRSKDLNNYKLWSWKSKSVAHIKEGRPKLYWVDKVYTPVHEKLLFSYPTKEDLYDELYKVRARHSSKGYPYYTSAWDDRYPSAIYDRHSYQ
jgi:hypothetical protein